MTPGGWLRFATRLLCLIALLLVFVPLHYAWRAFRPTSPIPRLFLRYSAHIAGARVERIGAPLTGKVLFVSNHISWLDILALAGATGTAFVAKYEVGTVPVIGAMARMNRTIFVRRGDRSAVGAQVDTLRDALLGGDRVTVFPEGTTTDGQSLLAFKTAMLGVLEPPPPGIMVQPVVMDYGAVAADIGWTGDEGGFNNAKRLLSRRGTFPLKMHFLMPFSPEDFGDRKAIGARARDAIEAALLTTLDRPLPPFEHDVVPVRYNPPNR